MIVPALLAGGTGTRLWPLSRAACPKQFLKLVDDRTLLQATAERARRIPDTTPPLVLCSEGHRFIVAEQLRLAGAEDADIILEPEGRNTAPAAAVAALHAARQHGEDALVFVMSADHLVRDEAAFCEAAARAAALAAQGRIVTFGIRPSRAETGYGWIKRGAALGKHGFELECFVEKPDARTAARYLADGGYDWNGGLFLFPAGLLISEMERLEPDTLSACRDALDSARQDLDFLRLAPAAFARARADSIDYAVMEKTRRAALVPMDAGWDDIGSWSYLSQLEGDIAGNVTRGDVELVDSRNTLVYADARLVAGLGMDNAVIVETQDAVLVAHRDRVQDVKHLVEHLRGRSRREVDEHARVLRPWGSYETLAEGPRFQVKRILVKPGQRLSLQMHHHRSEHWIVVKGTALVTREDEEFLVSENESTYIPLGARHRLANPGKVPLELIEVQAGAYLGEDDIIRIDDVYGRHDSPL